MSDGRAYGDGDDRYRGYGPDKSFLTPLNREPIRIIKVGDPAPPSSGAVRFIVPLGSQRIVTKVTVRYMPDNPGAAFPNLRVVEEASLWMALRDRNRAGNEGHVVGVRNVIGSRATPVLIPAPAEPAVDADGLAGHSIAFGGPGVLFPIPFLGDRQYAFSPTGIYDEVIGELTVNATPTPCPPGGWWLQTRWEPAVPMAPDEWNWIKTLLDPRVGQGGTVATVTQE